MYIMLGCLLMLFQRQKIEEVEELLLWLRHLLDLILDALPDESIMGMSEDCPLIISDDSEDEEDEEPWSPFNLQDVLVCMYMALSPCITSLCVCVCVCVCVQE